MKGGDIIYQLRILNENEVEEINNIYGKKFYSIIIKQEGSRYYAILDCDIKIKLYEKEALKYFSN